MSTSLEVDLPKRPGFGTKGKPAKIALNSYAVTRFPTQIIHQYDVTIGKGDEKRALIKKIWFSDRVQAAFGAAKSTVLFDGNKLAWSVVPFPFGERMTLQVDLDEGDTRPRRTPRDNTHKVVITKSGRVPLQVVEAFVKGQYRLDNDVLVGINFLDHLMRETPSKNFIAIKRSFFQQSGARELEGGVEAWKGIFQSVRATQGGRLTINVDVATAAFWSQGTVLEIALRLLRINTPQDLANRVQGEGPKGRTMRDLARIKRVSFFCKHRQRDSEVKKTYSIDGFAQNATEFTFELKRPSADGGFTTTTITAFDYFLKQYNLRLKFPNLPLVKTKKKGEVFPMELCFIAEGQRYPFKLDDRQTADMIKFTVQRPNVRAEQIRANVAQLEWHKDPLLVKYGMEIDTNMIKSAGRVMPTPKISYGAGSQEQVFAPRDGKWDLRGKKFAKLSSPVVGWGVMVFGHPRFCDEATVKNFIRVFITTYSQHGGVIVTKDPPIMYADSKKAVGTNIFELYKKAGNKVNAKPQMLVFILQQKSAQPYNEIKAYCDINIGVASQCLQSKHVAQAKPQYCSNVSMKFNAKLGGATCYLDKSDHPLFGKDPSIIVGADVSHASPGIVKSSFASMVGSTDLQGSRFAAIANTNGYRVEVITTKNMIKFMCTLLRAFKAATGKIPLRIFYFRDGVSEGQYQHIIEQELHDMREACKVLQSDYNPKITVTICSKRHHSRFFPIDRIAQDRNGNCVPGTIIEKDITHPTEYDFYLAAHNAIQGTARPVHYHVIHDENQMPVDAFQALVYNTCYTYCRASNSVSLIPAAYYAHLASTRARAHENTSEDTHTVTTATSGSGGRDTYPPTEAPDLRPLHDGLKHAMCSASSVSIITYGLHYTSSHGKPSSLVHLNIEDSLSGNYHATELIAIMSTVSETPQPTPHSTTKPQILPCRYKTGKTLGAGSYSVVKECVHIDTGRYYASKVINKRLMAGREHMVRNEIAVLKRVSMGHQNILTLVDYFETMNNLYLVTDLALGGELFDRICRKGFYYESDASDIIRATLSAVAYLHDHGIVHRDLKPENLLFRTAEDNSDLLIADFGLSRIMDEEQFHVLTTTCGTPGYMAPEIFKKTGHGKPVDVWAIGVITYFLLCGYTPFDRDSHVEEMQAILAADYKFEPKDYWENVSETARDFIRKCLTVDPKDRMTAHKALEHPFLSEDHLGKAADLLPIVRKNFNARRTLHAAIDTIRAINKLREGGVMDGALSISPENQKEREVEKESVGLWRKPAGGLMKN